MTSYKTKLMKVTTPLTNHWVKYGWPQDDVMFSFESMKEQWHFNQMKVRLYRGILNIQVSTGNNGSSKNVNKIGYWINFLPTE